MPDNALIHAFRALPTSESRSDALAALFTHLSPYEWRLAQAHLNTRDWRYDVIANLPIELVANVFAHLDTSAPFRLQQVSRRWHSLLQSPIVLKSNLKTWYHGKIRLENLDYYECKRIARGINSFCTGQHVDVFTQYQNTRLEPECVVLVQETLVGCLPGRRSLFVTNLRTGASWQTHGLAREQMTRLAASEHVIAVATTSNTCYVSDLSGKRKHSFKLTSNMFQALTCHGTTVVCGGVSKNHAEIYVWDFTLCKGSSFRVDFNQHPFSHRKGCCYFDLAILANSHTKSLILFTSNRCQDVYCVPCYFDSYCPEIQMHYARFGFDGRPLEQHGTSELMSLACSLDIGCSFTSFQPMDRCGGYFLSIKERHRNFFMSRTIYFDEEQFKFIIIKEPPRVGDDHDRSSIFRSALWEGTFYHPLPSRSGKQDMIPFFVGQKDGDVTFHSIIDSDHEWKKEDFHKLRNLTWVRLLLNDQFAVIVHPDNRAIDVYAFEKQPVDAALAPL